jgi:hypothetical protein
MTIFVRMFEDRFEERIASTLDAADDLDDQPDTDEPHRRWPSSPPPPPPTSTPTAFERPSPTGRGYTVEPHDYRLGP